MDRFPVLRKRHAGEGACTHTHTHTHTHTLHPLRTSDSPFLPGPEGGFEFFNPHLSGFFSWKGECVCVCVCVCACVAGTIPKRKRREERVGGEERV